MKRHLRSALATAALAAGLAACQGGGDDPDIAENPDAVVPDRPAPALSDPASPAPVGTDVGTLNRDTSGGPVANDSVAVPGR